MSTSWCSWSCWSTSSSRWLRRRGGRRLVVVDVVVVVAGRVVVVAFAVVEVVAPVVVVVGSDVAGPWFEGTHNVSTGAKNWCGRNPTRTRKQTNACVEAPDTDGVVGGVRDAQLRRVEHAHLEPVADLHRGWRRELHGAVRRVLHRRARERFEGCHRVAACVRSREAPAFVLVATIEQVHCTRPSTSGNGVPLGLNSLLNEIAVGAAVCRPSRGKSKCGVHTNRSVGLATSNVVPSGSVVRAGRTTSRGHRRRGSGRAKRGRCRGAGGRSEIDERSAAGTDESGTNCAKLHVRNSREQPEQLLPAFPAPPE